MGVENRPKFNQRGERELGSPDSDRSTDRGISHPSRKLSRKTRLDLDVDDLTTTAAVSRIEPNPLTVERMPGVLHHDELRSVCGMTWSVAT